MHNEGLRAYAVRTAVPSLPFILNGLAVNKALTFSDQMIK